ncbi:hypothetical protein GGH11_09485 [Streptococcus sp. zg-70]|uniref:Uncharacterized protein n=2 Tax=Streptococcus zhangguiae TaxID=2664091 RepID=A0A6I4RBK6_9STRE|nr:hypothetical protein [Streptococcus sp. zg-70]
MTTKRKRARLYFGMRNYKFETHDQDGNRVDDITENDWREKVSRELENVQADELTYIFHDRDIDTDGERKALHVHFVARFANPMDYEPTREKFGCEPRNFEKGRSESSALLYLTHTTPESIKAKKTRYNVQELTVVAIDEEGMLTRREGEQLEEWYRIKIAGKAGSLKANTDDDVASIIDELAEGTMLLTDVKEELKQRFDSTTATMTWMKNKRYFKEAVAEYYQDKYLEWLEKGRTFSLIYLEGPSAIGKTKFANKIARRVNKAKGIPEGWVHNAPNDTPGARYDFLNGYEQEVVTVFDDLNPKTFGYTEFLNLFEKERVAKYSSRFNDKAWFAEVAIITKSTSIDSWTTSLSYSELKTDKSGETANILYQPRRRFSLIINIEHDRVKISKYVVANPKTNAHELQVLKEFKTPNGTFFDNEFQEEVLDEIAKYLGLAEATEEDVAEVLQADSDTVGRLIAFLEDSQNGENVQEER